MMCPMHNQLYCYVIIINIIAKFAKFEKFEKKIFHGGHFEFFMVVILKKCNVFHCIP